MKKVSLILLSIAATLGLSACSSGGSGQATGNSSSSNKNGDNSSGKVTVKFVSGFTQSDVDAMRNDNTPGLDKSNMVLYDAVTKNLPNVNVNFQNWGWAEELDSKQRAALLSGDVPDIVEGETFIPSYANEDILTPLPDDIVKMVNPSFLIKDKSGKPVAVARSGSLFLLYYNKDLIRKAGLDPDHLKLDTWDDWKKASDAVTAAGNGKFFGGGIPTHPHFGGGLRVTAIGRSIGLDLGGGNKVTIDTPANIETLKYVREMDKNFPKGLGNSPDEGPLYTKFEKDKQLAFVETGSWEESSAKANGVDFGVAPLPVGPDGKPSNCRVGFVYYGVTKASKHKNESFDVLRKVLAKDTQVQLAKYGQLVSNNEVEQDAANVYKDYPAIQAMVKLLQTNQFDGLPVYDKNNAQIWDIINSKVIARTTMTNDPVEQIVKEGQAEAEKLLK